MYAFGNILKSQGVCRTATGAPWIRIIPCARFISIPPLADTALHIRAEKPARVYLAPSGEALPFECREGYVRVTVPKIDIHAMVVMDMTGGASTAPTPGVLQDRQVV
jgi:hypothetical protein